MNTLTVYSPSNNRKLLILVLQCFFFGHMFAQCIYEYIANVSIKNVGPELLTCANLCAYCVYDIIIMCPAPVGLLNQFFFSCYFSVDRSLVRRWFATSVDFFHYYFYRKQFAQKKTMHSIEIESLHRILFRLSWEDVFAFSSIHRGSSAMNGQLIVH